MKEKKSAIVIKRNLFRILAVAMFVVSIACGILLAKAEVRSFTVNTTISVTKTFEWWRFVLFVFVGAFGGGCLWAVSEVFDELEKMKNRKKK